MRICNKFLRTFFFFWCLTAFYHVQAAPSAPAAPALLTLLPLSPINVSGHQIVNKFASQSDFINVIRWDAPTDSIPIVSYAIYRDNELTEHVATIPANGKLKIKDHNRKENHTYTYFLVSVGADGSQSNAVEIIFKGSHVRVRPAKPYLLSIEVAPLNPVIRVDFTKQFTAIGLYSDNSLKDLTQRVQWNSSKPRVASISNSKNHAGLATGLKPGTTQITATLHGITGSTTATVSDAVLISIEVAPANSRLAAGFSRQFTATGTFSDGMTDDITADVTWTSTNPLVASISKQGLATGINSGTTTIEASAQGITGLTTLTVTAAVLTSIEVSPFNSNVVVNMTEQLTATGVFSDDSTLDLTNTVTWSVANPAIASVSNATGSKGLVTGLSSGSTFVIAHLNNVTGSAILSVSSAVLLSIEVTPVNPSLAIGFTQQFRAVGTYDDGLMRDLTSSVMWASSNPTVATISNALSTKGLATGHAGGSTSISANLDGVTGSTTLTVTAVTLVSITITPVNTTLPAGFDQQYIATGHFSDGTTQNLTNSVSWISSNPAVASISNSIGNKGRATGLTAGIVTIAAMLDGIMGSTSLIVTNAVLTSIAVTPADSSLASGLTIQFTATGTFSDFTTKDITEDVLWVSSDSAIASISNAPITKGLATAREIGTVTISARSTVTGSTTLTVTQPIVVSITISPSKSVLLAPEVFPFTATGLLSDGTMQDLTTLATWTTDNPAIITVSNTPGSQGVVTTHLSGAALLSATFNGVTGSTVVKVSCPSVTITTTSLAIALAGTPYMETIQTSGAPNPTFALTRGILPAGLILDPFTGIISGTPTTPARNPPTFTITVTNVCGSFNSKTFQILVACPPLTFTAPPLAPGGGFRQFPPAIVGQAYSSTATTTGPLPIFTVTQGTLPLGLTLSSSGILSGIPLMGSQGNYSFTIQAFGACGAVNSVFHITIGIP